MKSASKMISSGATLASNMGGALASAATTGLAAIPLPKWMDSPAPARWGWGAVVVLGCVSPTMRLL
jgi:hypothetical protein